MAGWGAVDVREWGPGRRLLGAGLLAGAAVAAWGVLVEPRWLRLRRVRVPIPGLAPGLRGLRVGLLADLHLGGVTPDSTVERAVDRLDREEPDLVAIAGDLVDRRSGDLDRALVLLEGLRAPLGVWVVPGNHDRALVEPELWRRLLDDHPTLGDLRNRSVVMERGGGRICLAGVDDLQEGEPQLRLPPREERDLTLVLAHEPDHADRVEGEGIDLVLSGHTHGGQVRLPILGSLWRDPDRYDAGLRDDVRPRIYITRGVGTTGLRLRLGVRPEVTVLELVAEG